VLPCPSYYYKVLKATTIQGTGYYSYCIATTHYQGYDPLSPPPPITRISELHTGKRPFPIAYCSASGISSSSSSPVRSTLHSRQQQLRSLSTVFCLFFPGMPSFLSGLPDPLPHHDLSRLCRVTTHISL
jgi:hypothetical protein